MATRDRGMNRRAVALALASVALAAPAAARDRKAKERQTCCPLSIGFNYQGLGAYGLPAVGTGDVAFEVAGVMAPVLRSRVTMAVDEAGTPCTRQRLEGIVDEWAKTVTGDDVAVIYYSGHGAVKDGLFHIVTPDPALVPFQDILDLVDARRPTAIVAFIDACRVPALDEANIAAIGVGNDQSAIPKMGLDGGARDLLSKREADSLARDAAASSAGSQDLFAVRGDNTLLIYSTELLSAASAGQTDTWNSPFAEAFQRYIGAQVDVLNLSTLIARDVLRVRGQKPWITGYLSKSVFLAGEAPRYGRARDAWLNIPH